MIKTVAASTALFAARALALGNAIVVNHCDYPVHMANTPAQGGGFSAIDQILSPGDSYSQQWTSLTNTMGWSLKLSKNGDYSNNVLQYEYTCHDDGTIWYDLSEVNGNPWNGNWEITASKGCSPRQAAYRYATDDAYGMQDCPDDSDITVTICSGTGHAAHKGGKKHHAPAPSPSPSPEPVSSAAPTSSSSSSDSSDGWGIWDDSDSGKVEAPAGDAVVDGGKKALGSSPSTMATEVSSAPTPAYDGPAVTVTNVHMETVTSYVTHTASPNKRHVHHPRHAHHRF